MSARPVPMHIHIDAVGGIAGDMFAAAMLDAWPALGEGLVDALRSAGLAKDVGVRWEKVDEMLAGSRFVVDDPREHRPARPHAVLLHAHAGHDHVSFKDVRTRIEGSSLNPRVIARALDIFSRLAAAEAQVHGFALAPDQSSAARFDDVMFHEVGAMDSVADIVAAAWLIEGAGAATWSCAPLPLGSGTVMTAHGLLPIPTPATAILLQGLATHDDGRTGERVTPTGAAIVQHVLAGSSSSHGARKPPGVLGTTGTGWGSKRFTGLPNIVRVLEIVDAQVDARATCTMRDEVAVLSFDVDDQPAEDLAVALEHLRAHQGVIDVLQAPAFGKKGRMVAMVRVLCTVVAEGDVVDACLRETTTLGVRVERQARVTLARHQQVLGGVRVKTAQRPDGSRTAKADIDDVATLPSTAARANARRAAEDGAADDEAADDGAADDGAADDGAHAADRPERA